MNIIEAHAHIYVADDSVVEMLREMGMRVVNICVAHDSEGDWRKIQVPALKELARRWPEQFVWVTSFDPPSSSDFEAPEEYARRVVRTLEEDFAAGALGCKVWKNIGMEVRRPDGKYIMVDDPLFRPIFEYLTGSGRPLIAHIGEPLACWQPLTAENLHAGYYRQHPEWHMYGRTDIPSHGEQVASLERLVGAHHGLPVIGAHIASLEYDVDEAAARLDTYPNLAMDLSARIPDLAAQDAHKVARFLTRYRDRLLFGMDLVFGRGVAGSSMADMQALKRRIQESYGDAVQGIVVPGVEVAAGVTEDILFRNAKRWIPGL